MDILDHFLPHARITLDREVDLLGIDRIDLAHVLELEDLELEHEIALLAVAADSNAEGGIDKAQAPELLLLRHHLVFQRAEILGRGERYCHSRSSGIQLLRS